MTGRQVPYSTALTIYNCAGHCIRACCRCTGHCCTALEGGSSTKVLLTDDLAGLHLRPAASPKHKPEHPSCSQGACSLHPQRESLPEHAGLTCAAPKYLPAIRRAAGVMVYLSSAGCVLGWLGNLPLHVLRHCSPSHAECLCCYTACTCSKAVRQHLAGTVGRTLHMQHLTTNATGGLKDGSPLSYIATHIRMCTCCPSAEPTANTHIARQELSPRHCCKYALHRVT